MNMIHKEWKLIQELLRDIDLQKFRDSPVVRKWLLSVSDGITADQLLSEAYKMDPDTTEHILKHFYESNVGTRRNISPQSFTTKSALQIVYAVKLKKQFPEIKGFNILELGGGYGGLARLFLMCDLCRSYNICDISVINTIQNYFLNHSLEEALLPKFKSFNLEDSDIYSDLCGRSFDLFISTFALTESPINIHKQYIEKIISQCKYVYIAGQKEFKGEVVIRNILEHLNLYFEIEVYEYPYYSRPAFELVGKRK